MWVAVGLAGLIELDCWRGDDEPLWDRLLIRFVPLRLLLGTGGPVPRRQCAPVTPLTEAEYTATMSDGMKLLQRPTSLILCRSVTM